MQRQTESLPILFGGYPIRPGIARSMQTRYGPVKDHPFFDRRNNYPVGRKVG
jgi:hypothetical protein